MKNLFTADNAVMLLIDHQVGIIKFSTSTPHDEIVRNARALARTAIATKMPLVLTTSEENQFQGPLLSDLKEIAPAQYEQRVKRPGAVDAWTYNPYREAVEKFGRKKLIMSGLTNDVCVVYPAISATEAGYEVQVVVDAGGSPTKAADEVALRRMERHGVMLTSTNQIMAELAMDWATPHGLEIKRIMYEEILRNYLESAPMQGTQGARNLNRDSVPAESMA